VPIPIISVVAAVSRFQGRGQGHCRTDVLGGVLDLGGGLTE
jgi:hypothetical protein